MQELSLKDVPPGKTYCDICEHFADRENRSTECDKCLPELMPENLDIWKIYSVVSGQLIMSAAGPVDVNHLAIYRAMDLYGIENKHDCFERVTKLAKHMINLIREKHKK